MKRIKEDIKNRTFKNLYLLFGEEDYLKKTYSLGLKRAVLQESDDMNYSYFEGKDIDVLSVKEISDTLPFFSDYRFIFIENSGFFKSANDLADYVSDIPETTVIVFSEKEVDKRNKLYKYVNKNGLAVEMNQMSPADTRKFVAGTLKENKKLIRESTAGYLLEKIDNSLTNVLNELEKLIAYTDGREEITISDIDAVCSVQVTGKVFQMIDAASMGKGDETLKLYRDLLELRESPMSILYLLMRQFNILLQVKSIADMPKGEIASKVGIAPFFVAKYVNQAKRFDEEKLKSFMDNAVDIEYRFKRGLIGDQIGVELLLAELCSVNVA